MLVIFSILLTGLSTGLAAGSAPTNKAVTAIAVIGATMFSVETTVLANMNHAFIPFTASVTVNAILSGILVFVTMIASVITGVRVMNKTHKITLRS